ncbi:hypothetical protein Sgleb_00170 [Streptomyces glebosus]|uniref:Uncharacterized protein n=1 Tax=Streptomyces glebosus TaxID=249580 RepID=A0A640SLV9_9ACTN|nr:hypothetical protein Sgleb_00170 [Streptomyces glebosus]GHG74543.1 hypothetical protein GCM10010513_48670 [Streptomyces glebosus]
MRLSQAHDAADPVVAGPTCWVNTITSGGYPSRPSGPYRVSHIGTGFPVCAWEFGEGLGGLTVRRKNSQ